MAYSNNIPTVIFSHPPIGCVGYNEEGANKKFGKDNVKVYKSDFTNMFYSLTTDDHERLSTMYKVICHIEPDGTERVVGVHGIGRGIDEMMQSIAVCVNMKATKQDFDNTVAIHPTASEELVLMNPNLIC